MSGVLFGRERSGTPKETRRATKTAARGVEQYLGSGGTEGPLAGMQQRAIMNMLGFDPATIGLGAAAERALIDPRDQTAGLFAAMIPFEERQTSQAVSGLRGGFGEMGGRFSRNLVDAETMLRGEMAAQFARTREQALLQAQDVQNQAMASLMQGAIGAGDADTRRLAAMYAFLNPGSPNWQQGVLGDIIAAAGAAAGAAL